MSGLAARAAYRQRLSAAMHGDPAHPMHGTATGWRDGDCRCLDCSAAHRGAVARWRRGSTTEPTTGGTA